MRLLSKMWSGVDGWMGVTPQTVMTTRAPAVLKMLQIRDVQSDYSELI